MPERPVIVNTSPLIYLGLVDHLWVFERLYGEVRIPTAVKAEYDAGLRDRPDVPSLDRLAWIQVRAVTSPALIPSVIDLGRGEAEVIALGLEAPGALLVLDDQLGRRIAELNRLTYTGTLGVLLKGKQQGVLPSIMDVVSAMRARGMWLSDDLVSNVARLAGERAG